MDDLASYLKEQQETYNRDNNYNILISTNQNKNFDKLLDLNTDEEIFYKILRNFRNYKLSYSQGKFYQNLNTICITSCNRNTNIHQYILLDHKILETSNCKLLVNNKAITYLDNFITNKNYEIEEDYENLSIHLNENLKINFEIIGNSFQIKLDLSLEKNIPDLYFNSYLKEIEKIVLYINSVLED